jgi:hypothetical protein
MADEARSLNLSLPLRAFHPPKLKACTHQTITPHSLLLFPSPWQPLIFLNLPALGGVIQYLSCLSGVFHFA